MSYIAYQIKYNINIWIIKLGYWNLEHTFLKFLFMVFALYIYELNKFFMAYFLGIPKKTLFRQYNINPTKIVYTQFKTAILVPLLCIILMKINSSWFGVAWTKLPNHQKTVKHNKYIRFSEILIVLSGLIVNMIFAISSLILFNIFYKIGLAEIELRPKLEILFMYTKMFTEIHLSFVLMHLLPLPPFSGFIILRNLLPHRLAKILNKVQNYPKLIFILSIYILVNYITEPVHYLDDIICDWLGSIIIPRGQ